MAFYELENLEDAVNASRLAVEEGKLVFVLANGKREEHSMDGEVSAMSAIGFSGDRLSWKERGKKVEKPLSAFKSVNGVQKDKYKK
ncbi:hypothetical protein ACYSNU_07160 [Enterococcus sp. LJL120]